MDASQHSYCACALSPSGGAGSPLTRKTKQYEVSPERPLSCHVFNMSDVHVFSMSDVHVFNMSDVSD